MNRSAIKPLQPYFAVIAACYKEWKGGKRGYRERDDRKQKCPPETMIERSKDTALGTE